MQTLPRITAPTMVQVLNWVFRPTDYMETNFHRHGDIFQTRVAMADWLFVNDPEALKYIFTHDSGDLTAPGELNQILSGLLGFNSVIMLSGESHRQRRQLIMPPFHGERLKAYADLIQEITLEVMKTLKPGDAFKARDITQTISMKVILEAVFGLREGERYQKLEALLKDRLNMVSSPASSLLLFFPWLQKDLGSWSLGAKIKAASEEIDQLLYAEIAERRAQEDPNRTDILSLLVAAKDEAGNGLTDEELRDELMTLLVAGHETTATAMAWSLYWVHRYPEIAQRLRDEIQADPANQTPTALTKLPYLTAVCQETLRIHPVAMLTFPRRVEKPVTIAGQDLAPGTVVVGCIYLVHHREDLYPNAHQFNPDHFLERQYSAFEFMPFGAGVRRCVGAALAMSEMKIVLGTLLTQFEFALTNPEAVKPQRRGVTLGMSTGVEMVLKGRRAPLPQMAVV